MQCRTNRRAAWAAQLAQDAGLQNCLVYRQVSTQELQLNMRISNTSLFAAVYISSYLPTHMLLLLQRSASTIDGVLVIT
jgi:hypothetical protein